MTMLKEQIDRIIVKQPADIVFSKISTALSNDDFQILEKNDSDRLISIRCLVELFDMMVWRCWGDKLQLHFETNNNQVEVHIYGIPNLFRWKIKKGETVYSKSQIKEKLHQLIQNAVAKS